MSNRSAAMVVVTRSKGERKRIRCEVCGGFPDIVKKLCYRGRIPQICTMTGAEARSDKELSHGATDAHRKAVKAERIKGLSDEEKVETVPLYQVS